MKNKSVFLICLATVLTHIVLAENQPGGYFYEYPKLPQLFDVSQTRPHESQTQEFSQELKPPPLIPQQGQLNLPFIPNSANSALHQQPYFNHPAESQLNNINNLPPQQFNSQQQQNVMRIQFEVMNENQGSNSIEQGCNNPEPIVGQFKPELVDLANGGPLTRMITTCGPDTDCKTIALQSDLNRVLAVFPNGNYNQNRPQYHGDHRGYVNNREIEGRGNAGNSINADPVNLLVRPPNRRLIQYTEIVQDDIYN